MFRPMSRKQSFEAIEKEARHLQRAVRRGDAPAFARWYSLDPEARERTPRMADIHYIIAREYGFRSWQSLRDLFNRTAANFG